MALNFTPEQKAELKRRLLAGELDANSPEGKQLFVTRFKDEPLAFATSTLGHHMVDQSTGVTLKSPHFHTEMMDLYMQNRFVGLAAPRNHAKSTVTTLFYVIYCILFLKKRNIVIISSTEDMAIRFLRRIKDELTQNKFILWAFGQQQSDKWSETEIRTTTGVVVHAKGRGAQLRGLIDGANRPDLIILDDAEDDEMVRSELRRFDFESWFNATVLPTLAPGSGQCIVLGTILHMDSLLNRIVNQHLYPEFVTQVYAAIQDDGSSLWPDRFPIEALEKMKASYIARDQLAQFYMEWMNDPVPQENAEFKVFTYFDKQHDMPPNPYVELTVDTGGGSVKKGADDTAMVVTASDEKNTLYVLDYISDKMGTDTDLIIDNIFKLDDLYHPQVVRIEKTTASNFLITALEKRMLNDGHYLNVEYVQPPRGSGDRRGNMSDGKYQRIAAMASPMKLGAIRIQKWMTKLLEQLQMFPRAKHDDVADTLGYAWMFAQRRVTIVDGDMPHARKDPNDPLGIFQANEEPAYEPLYDELGI